MKLLIFVIALFFANGLFSQTYSKPTRIKERAKYVPYKEWFCYDDSIKYYKADIDHCAEYAYELVEEIDGETRLEPDNIEIDEEDGYEIFLWDLSDGTRLTFIAPDGVHGMLAVLKY